MDNKEFFDNIDKFRNPLLWQKDGESWELKTQVF